MGNNYFEIIERISGRIDKLCKKGVLKGYRAGSGNMGYSLAIEDSRGNITEYNVPDEGTGFKEILEELKRLERLKR